MPGGGWIAAGAPHRNWLEPLLIFGVLPAHRRVITVADGRTVTRSWARRRLAQLMGGAIAVGPAGRGEFADHVAAAARVLHGGAVLAIFPETGPPAPPPQLRRVSAGVAWFAAGGGAPVVPIIFGGTAELYLRRRIEVRILPPVAPPPRDADRAAIEDWLAAFRAAIQVAAVEADAVADAHPPRRKWWRWLTGSYPQAG